MATDLVLAIIHHILVFGLATLIASEAILLRADPKLAQIDRLARIDAAYGGSALAVIIVGVLRVIFGLKGYEYYVTNTWFWAKMACFVAVGLLSIRPTLQFQAWRRARRADPAFVPAAGEVQSALKYLRFETMFFGLVIVFAATMARYA